MVVGETDPISNGANGADPRDSMTEFDRHFVDTYRAWHKLAQANGDAVIDCDIVGEFPSEYIFETSNDVRAALEKLQDDTPSDIPPLVAAKLGASLVFGEFDGSERPRYYEYIQATTGLLPVLFDEEELTADIEIITSHLNSRGFGWHPEYRDAYNATYNLAEDEETLKSRFRREASWAVSQIAKYAMVDGIVIEPLLNTEDSTFQGATYTDDGDIIVEASLHPDVLWKADEVVDTMIHEPSHAVHLTIIERLIREGKLSPTLGITTLHSPEMVHFETIATTTCALVLGQEKDYALQRVLGRYGDKVWTNAHFMINNGKSLYETESYVSRHLPLRPTADIKDNLIRRRDVPVERTYHAAYGPAMLLGDRILEMPADKQREVMSKLYSSFATGPEIIKMLDQATAPSQVD